MWYLLTGMSCRSHKEEGRELKFDVIVCGVGGQGVVLLSRVIAEAALLSGYSVRVSERRGLAQREGSVCSHVRIGRCFSPTIPLGHADLMLAMDMYEALRHIGYLSDEGKAVVNLSAKVHIPHHLGINVFPDPSRVKALLNERSLFIDAESLAARLGNAKVTNIIVLGASMRFMPLRRKKFEEALRIAVPERYLDLNLKALREGELSWST